MTGHARLLCDQPLTWRSTFAGTLCRRRDAHERMYCGNEQTEHLGTYPVVR
jgi:hypothetical protein